MALAIGFGKPINPILGLVMAGEVDSTGENVKRFKTRQPGLCVHPMAVGSYGEYICLPEDTLMAPKPANVTYGEWPRLFPYGGLLALCFSRKGKDSTPPENSDLRSVGGGRHRGCAAGPALRRRRHRGGSTANVEMVKSMGAETVVDYTREDFTTRPERYDLIFNAVGTRKARLQCEGALTPGGKHITVDDGLAKLRMEGLVLLKELVEAGTFKPVINRTYALEQIVEAHRYVDKGHKKGNVLILV